MWRLSERELEVWEESDERNNNNYNGYEEWCGLKRKLLDVVSEVCSYDSYTKGKPRQFET